MEALNLTEQILADAFVHAPQVPLEPLLLVDEEPVALIASERSGRARSGIPGLIGMLVLPWSEQRHAARTARAVLGQFQALVARHPELAGAELYRRLVMEFVHCDEACAQAILDVAQDSYASWPVERPLKLRDVAHYLSVSGFLTAHVGAGGMRSDVRHLISDRIPRNL